MVVEPIQILLVDDNEDDAELTRLSLERSKVINARHIHHVTDGEAAMAFLRRQPPYEKVPQPDLVLLDLHMPKKGGREVLEEIRADPRLTSLPVVILSTSDSPEDIARSYARHANAFVTKPVDLDQFRKIVRGIDSFWLSVVRLPPRAMTEGA